jgi:hypothetical protein
MTDRLRLVEAIRDDWIVIKLHRTEVLEGGIDVSFAGVLPPNPRYTSLPPDADVIGKAFGAGTFLLIAPGPGSRTAREITIVEDSHYAEADEEAIAEPVS